MLCIRCRSSVSADFDADWMMYRQMNLLPESVDIREPTRVLCPQCYIDFRRWLVDSEM